jgi:diadenosine tetraphosphate (Ap4A) HIT family hydrolase
MSDCVFCAIVRGESPASLTHEDDTVIAFMDIQPITHGHMLVVPREHAVLMKDVDETAAMRAFWVARRFRATRKTVSGSPSRTGTSIPPREQSWKRWPTRSAPRAPNG